MVILTIISESYDSWKTKTPRNYDTCCKKLLKKLILSIQLQTSCQHARFYGRLKCFYFHTLSKINQNHRFLYQPPSYHKNIPSIRERIGEIGWYGIKITRLNKFKKNCNGTITTEKYLKLLEFWCISRYPEISSCREISISSFRHFESKFCWNFSKVLWKLSINFGT